MSVGVQSFPAAVVGGDCPSCGHVATVRVECVHDDPGECWLECEICNGRWGL